MITFLLEIQVIGRLREKFQGDISNNPSKLIIDSNAGEGMTAVVDLEGTDPLDVATPVLWLKFFFNKTVIFCQFGPEQVQSWVASTFFFSGPASGQYAFLGHRGDI